jgi:hypothetical protein
LNPFVRWHRRRRTDDEIVDPVAVHIPCCGQRDARAIARVDAVGDEAGAPVATAARQQRRERKDGREVTGLRGISPNAAFGRSLVGLGDVNRDSIPDIAPVEVPVKICCRPVAARRLF